MARKKAAKTDSEKILAALDNLHTCLEDLFVLEACRAGIKQQEIRAILGIDLGRVTRIGRHVKNKAN
jgi:DNA-directed RNA polymerase specialized sigma24 family protein